MYRFSSGAVSQDDETQAELNKRVQQAIRLHEEKQRQRFRRDLVSFNKGQIFEMDADDDDNSDAEDSASNTTLPPTTTSSTTTWGRMTQALPPSTQRTHPVSASSTAHKNVSHNKPAITPTSNNFTPRSYVSSTTTNSFLSQPLSWGMESQHLANTPESAPFSLASNHEPNPFLEIPSDLHSESPPKMAQYSQHSFAEESLFDTDYNSAHSYSEDSFSHPRDTRDSEHQATGAFSLASQSLPATSVPIHAMAVLQLTATAKSPSINIPGRAAKPQTFLSKITSAGDDNNRNSPTAPLSTFTQHHRYHNFARNAHPTNSEEASTDSNRLRR